MIESKKSFSRRKNLKPKTYFKRRTESAIKKLDIQEITNPQGLAKLIFNDLDADLQGLILKDFSLKPPQFRDHPSQRRASSLNKKHGLFLRVEQPKTQKKAMYEDRKIPLDYRDESISELRKIPEEEIFLQGLWRTPIMGTDRAPIITPFYSIALGELKYMYTHQKAGGIELILRDKSVRVGKEGATILARIPSKSQKRGRYELKMHHVPIEYTRERKFITYSTYSEYTDSINIPEDEQHFIRYVYDNSKFKSKIKLFGTNAVAANLAIIDYYANLKPRNLVPIEMVTFPLLPQSEMVYFNKLLNNVLIQDETIKEKDNLRRLHVDEISTMLARSFATIGESSRETTFADFQKDGKIKDYTWKSY